MNEAEFDYYIIVTKVGVIKNVIKSIDLAKFPSYL